MSLDAEIGIVGAGPAGTRAAELLATSGVDVLLLDPRAPWEKPCGGGLTPPAFREMPELEELDEAWRETRRVQVETASCGILEVALDQPIRMVSRRTLATWQLRRARRAGARLETARVQEIRRAEGGWRLRTNRGDRVVRVLVGADGAASRVRRVVAPDYPVELAPTRVAYPEGPGPTPDTVYLRFYSEVPGYLWDFPRLDHRSVGIMVTRHAWNRPRLDDEIDGYRGSGGRAADVDRAGAVIGTAYWTRGDYRPLAGDDFALLGDAAGLADPLTGEGIRNALTSGALFAQAWNDGGPNRYPRLLRETLEPEFRRARRMRRHLLETGRGVRIIEKGCTSAMSYAFVAGCVNALNEGEIAMPGVLARWLDKRAGCERPGPLYVDEPTGLDEE